MFKNLSLLSKFLRPTSIQTQKKMISSNLYCQFTPPITNSDRRLNYAEARALKQEIIKLQNDQDPHERRSAAVLAKQLEIHIDHEPAQKPGFKR